MTDRTHRTVGTLRIYIGPMFSGKTTRLIGDLTMFADTGSSVLYINHSLDNRDEGPASSHSTSFRSISPKIATTKVRNLSEVDVSQFDCIGIDEAQFFSDLLPVVERWVGQEAKHVVVAGLDGDVKMQPFGDVLRLIPYCNTVKKLHARCQLCLQQLQSIGFKGDITVSEAPFTARTIDNPNQTIIGGSEIYLPVCRYHHRNFTNTMASVEL